MKAHEYELGTDDIWALVKHTENDLYALIKPEVEPNIADMDTGEVRNIEEVFGKDRWNTFDDAIRDVHKRNFEQMVQRGELPLRAVTLDYKNRLLVQKL